MKRLYFILSLMLFGVLNSFGQITLTSRATGDWNSANTWLSANLTGTISTLTTSATVTGVGTSFTTELSVGAVLYRTDGTTAIGTVQSVTNNTTLVLTANAANTNSGINFRTRKIPGTNDHAVIANTHTVTLTDDRTCASLVVGGGASGVFNSTGGDDLTVTGNVTINAGAVFQPTADNNFTLGGNLLNNGTFNANNGGSDMAVTFNGATQSISGTGTFTFNDLTFTNNTSTTLGVSITAIAGALSVDAGATLNMGVFNISTPSALNLERGGTTTGATINGTGTISLGGNVVVTSVSPGGSSAAVVNPNISLGGTRTFNIADDGTNIIDIAINGTISGATFGLTKTGAGSLALSGNNTYTGATTVSAGELALGSANAIPGGIGSTGGTSNINISGGAVINLGAGNFSRPLGTGASQIQFTGSGGFSASGAVRTVNFGGAGATVTWAAGSFVPTGSTLILGSGSGFTTVDFQNPIALGNNSIRTIQVDGVTSSKISAAISGTGTSGITKTGSQLLELTAASTFPGTTTVNNGTLKLSNTAALGAAGTALVLNAGTTLELATDATINAYNTTINGTATINSNRATSGAGITHTLGTLSIGTADQLNVTVGANVAGGTAGLTFGATTLSAATPVFDVATGANLTLGALSGNFAFTKQNAGQLTLNTASARTGGTVTLSAGTMKLGIVNALGTTGVPLALNGGILDLATDATVNAYNVTVNGNATIASNRATSGAAITHTLGTLSLGTGDQLNVTVGSNVASGTANLTMGATTLSAATPLFDIAIDANLTLGALSGNFAFTKQGNGLMTLNTASARTAGTVTINTGSIRLGAASALGTAAVPVVLNTGSGLNLASAGSVNAHNVIVNGDASIFSNRSTSGPGITHTLGTLSIGNARLTVFYGDNVSDVTAGLTFGTTTLSAATPVFDVFAGGVTLTLGALTGNVAFNKDGGGRLVLNTASARTGGTVTLLDGTISLGATNGLGTTAVPLQLNGGVLDLATAATVNAYNTTIGGNVIITPNKNAAGVGITHVLGTLSTGAYTLDVNKGANVTSGTAAVQFGNLTMTGAPVFSPNTANLIMAGTASGAFKLTKSGAATLQKTTTAWTLGGDFEITAGTYDAGTLNTTLLGNWINNGGTHTASGASAVIFNGSSAQSIGGSASTIFNNLTVNNSNGVSLANNETVNAAVTLTNGNLVVPTGNTLTIANGNAIGGTGFDAAKSIVTQVNTGTGAKGFVRVNNMPAAAYLLPVSDGTYYLPVTLTATDVVANNSFSVCVFPGITEDGEPNGTPFSSNQKNRCVDAVWTVNYNGPGTPTAAPVTMKVDWPESLEGPFFSALGDNFIGIAHYGPNWGPCQATPLSGNNTTNTVSLNNITQFSPFGVGWIDPTGGVLAIKITYFNASKGNGFNTLNWQAACSSAQAVFELERSVDGVNFININSITATQARCASPFSYNDITAPAGTVFYRIKIIDVDGKVSYSAIVKLGSQVKGIELSGITPNPVMNTAQVKVNTIQKDVVTLLVIAADGKVVYRNSVAVQAGSSVINVEITNLPSGMYMLKGVFENGQTNTVKFIKQ